jgi:hypothetical protein
LSRPLNQQENAKQGPLSPNWHRGEMIVPELAGMSEFQSHTLAADQIRECTDFISTHDSKTPPQNFILDIEDPICLPPADKSIAEALERFLVSHAQRCTRTGPSLRPRD